MKNKNKKFDQSVTIGADFFLRERQNYSNWRRAVIREVIQNSVDARAMRIEIDIKPRDGGKTISVKDNGVGMNRDTLQNVFLVVGETSKKDANTVGGFGRARNL